MKIFLAVFALLASTLVAQVPLIPNTVTLQGTRAAENTALSYLDTYKLQYLGAYSSGVAYTPSAVVSFGGAWYVSLGVGNIGNSPATSPLYWVVIPGTTSSAITSVFGRTGAVTSQSGDYTTTQISEGTNLYFTNARAQSALAGLYQAPLTAYSTISALSGYPTSFNPVNSGNWAGNWQGYTPATFQTAITNYSTIAALTGYPAFGTMATLSNPLTAQYQLMVGGSGGSLAAVSDPGAGTWCFNRPSSGPPSLATCPGASGGLSSITWSVPSIFTMTPSPTTANGTVTLAYATGLASHQVLGSCGTATVFGPCFLVAGDIPSLPYISSSANYSVIAALTGYPTTFAPVNTGNWAGTFQTYSVGTTGGAIPLLNSANTWSAAQTHTSLVDLSGGTLKIPTSAGFTATASSMAGYDSTAGFPHIWFSGADKTFGLGAFMSTAAAGDISGTLPSATVAGLKGSALPALTNGLLRYNSGWTFDTNTYLTANQSITLSSDCTGTGTTTISITCTKTSGTSFGPFATLTNPATTGGDMWYWTGSALARLAFPGNGTQYALTWTSGVPAWGTVSSGGYAGCTTNGSNGITCTGIVTASSFASAGPFSLGGATQSKPTAPASGSQLAWLDSTNLLLQGENSSGTTVWTTVAPLSSATSHKWVSFIDNTGTQNLAQPAAADISGLGALATEANPTAAQVFAGFTGCSGTMYPGYDGTCHTISGGSAGGTVAVKTANYARLSTDGGSEVVFNGSSLTATLPSSLPTMPWIVGIKNINSSALTVSGNGNNINGGSSSVTLQAYQTTTCASDTVTGTNFVCDVPLVAGLGVGLTPLANGVTVGLKTFTSDVTSQSSSQSTVTVATSPAAGLYHLTYYADLKTPCTTGADSVSFNFGWTDGTNARSLQTGSLSLPSSQATNMYLSGGGDIWVGSGNVSYTSTVAGACGTGTSSYDIHVVLLPL